MGKRASPAKIVRRRGYIVVTVATGESFTASRKDTSLVREYSWHVSGNGYVAGVKGSRSDETRSRVYFHREVARRMGLSLKHEIDHRNLNPLNNRRGNLREATKAQQAMNQALRRSNTTGFKGVYRHQGKFMAAGTKNYRQVYLGVFDTAKDAHAAYCRWARKHFGAFTRLA